MLQENELNRLSREQLIELLFMDAKNLIAMDGVWFQSVEREMGMEAAMHHDEEAWKRYTRSEARRIMRFLGLEAHAGLEGLAKALPYRMVDRANPSELIWQGDRLICRILVCRVQEARSKKHMPLHPCKSAAIYEYGEFAKEIDDRIECRCMSCYPDVTDDTCACAWEFWLEQN